MPTVIEVLRQTGLSQEQIDAIFAVDPRAKTAFEGVLTTAESEKATATAAQVKAEADFKAAQEAVAKAEAERKAAQEAKDLAELQGRSNTEFYETKIVPGLTSWDEEKVRLENERVKAAAEAAFYRTQAEAAKAGGFIPNDAPGYTPPTEKPRDADGKYVAGGGGTPGSPTFMDPTKLAAQFSDKAAMLTNIDWRYRKLFGDVMPIPPSQLIAEADAQKLDPVVYAEKRFGFAARETELAAAAKRAHEEKLIADNNAAKEAEWQEKFKIREAEFAAEKKRLSEQVGNNPDVRTPQGSAKYAEIKKAVEAGDRPNPLKMTDAQRRAATRQAIHSEIESREGAVA